MNPTAEHMLWMYEKMIEIREYDAERAERIRLWRELDHPKRDAFPGDPRAWERNNAKTARLTQLGERLLGLTPWPHHTC